MTETRQICKLEDDRSVTVVSFNIPAGRKNDFLEMINGRDFEVRQNIRGFAVLGKVEHGRTFAKTRRLSPEPLIAPPA
jgi:hypothetical protein